MSPRSTRGSRVTPTAFLHRMQRYTMRSGFGVMPNMLRQIQPHVVYSGSFAIIGCARVCPQAHVLSAMICNVGARRREGKSESASRWISAGPCKT